MPSGKYQLVRKLAEGGMAEVFLANAEGPDGLPRQVVVKRILAELATDPAFVAMFFAEAKIAAQFKHPNIVEVLDFGKDDDRYYLAMEYIDGFHLRALCKSAAATGRPVPFELAARMVASSCEGLGYAHAFTEGGKPLNLIHRDISPDNLLIGRNGVVKVTDFGVAKVEGQARTTRTGMVKGKLIYMAPEQLKSEAIDHRVDIFALGIVLFELIAGRLPFQATSALLADRMAPLTDYRPDAPAALQEIISRAMAFAPDERFQTCAHLQQALERFISSRGTVASTQALAVFVADLPPADALAAPKPLATPKPVENEAVVESIEVAESTGDLPRVPFRPNQALTFIDPPKDPPRVPTASRRAVPSEPARVPTGSRRAVPKEAPEPAPVRGVESTGEIINPAAFRRSPVVPLIIAGCVVLAIGIGVWRMSASSEPEPTVAKGEPPPPPAPPPPPKEVEQKVKAEPAKAEPAKAETVKAEPAKAEPAKPEVARAEPPAKGEPRPAAPKHAPKEKPAPAPVVAAAPRAAPEPKEPAAPPPPAARPTPQPKAEPVAAKGPPSSADEWTTFGSAPAAARPAPAAAAAPSGTPKRLVGRVDRVGSQGFMISNDTDYAWHRCELRFPNKKFFAFADVSIDPRQQQSVRASALVEDLHEADQYIARGYVQVRCREGGNYIWPSE